MYVYVYVYNDDTYIPQHYDVVRAFQWLLRIAFERTPDTMTADHGICWSSKNKQDKRETKQKTAGQPAWKK